MTDPLADMDAFGALGGDAGSTMGERVPVSYTHLTLPTICSV